MQLRTCLSAMALLVGVFAIGSGCSAANEGGASPRKNDGSNGQGGSGGAPDFVDPGDGTDLDPPCNSDDPHADRDGDGYTPAQGDCNDCDARMNPGAYDFPDNGVDEDCNGVPDDEPVECDMGLPGDANSAIDAAKALGICRMHDVATRSWGLVNARWVFPDGKTASTGGGFLDPCPSGQGPHPQSRAILSSFGPNVSPTDGSSMLVISSGVAKPGSHGASGAGANGTSPGGGEMCTTSQPPPGFPMASPACPGANPIPGSPANDGIALDLEIRVPTNAKSLAFDFNFYTYEFPMYYCDQFNDFFVALLHSGHPQVPANKNISFDSQGNPISVNSAFVQVCKEQTLKGQHFPCAFGTAELEGTGFEQDGGHAATSWLQTKAGVVPGETILLRFAVWDASDRVLDSTALIDNFRWDVEEGEVETKPIPR